MNDGTDKTAVELMYDQYRNDSRFGTEHDFEAFTDAYFNQIEQPLIEIVEANSDSLTGKIMDLGNF